MKLAETETETETGARERRRRRGEGQSKVRARPGPQCIPVYVRLDDAFLEQDLQQPFLLLAAVQNEGHVGAFGHPRQHPQHALLLRHAHVVGEVVFVQPAFPHCNDLSAAREGLDVRHLGLDVEPGRRGERVRPRLRRDDIASRI
jgi:hypothetical protein